MGEMLVGGTTPVTFALSLRVGVRSFHRATILRTFANGLRGEPSCLVGRRRVDVGVACVCVSELPVAPVPVPVPVPV